MSKIDEFKKKYKFLGAEEEEERKASSSPIEEFKKKYNITTTDETDKLGSYERSKRESKTSQVISSNFDRMGSSTGIDGYKKYLEDEEAKKTAPKYDLNNDGQDAWWEKALAYLGGGGGGVVDTSLPTAGVTQAVHDLREDESYKRPSKDWSVKQKSEFGELYLTSPESAFAYAEKTNKQNNKRKEESEIDKIQREATKNFGYGVGHTVGAIATAPLGMADYLGDLAYAAAGRDIAPDGSVSPFEYSQAVTGGISEHLNEEVGTLPEDWWMVGGKGLGDVYGLGTSIAQSMASAYTLGPAGTLVSYFGQAAAAGVDDAIARGASDDQALLYGAALGTFEGVAEMIGIDNLFKLGSASTVKGLIKNVIKQAGAEGGEEFFTAVTSEIADRWIMADKSNFNILVEELMAQGMSEADAKMKAWMSTLGDIAFDTIAGAVSGSVSGGIHSGVQTAITNADAKANYSGQAQDMVSEALASEDANTRTVGEKYQKMLNDNKKLSGWDISHLLETTDTQKVKSAVEAQLTKLGESGDVSTLAEVITKQTQGIELSKKEQAIIDGSKFGQRVVNTLKRENIKSGEYDTRWAKDIGTRRLNADVYNKSLSDHISDAVDAERKARLELRETDSVTENAASEENAAESEISPSVVVKNAEGKTVNAEIQSVEVDGDNVSFTLSNGEKVDSDNVAFKSENAKIVADTALGKAMEVKGFSNEAATAMIKGYDGSISPENYTVAFNYAFELGANGVPSSNLTRAINLGVSERVAYTAYELGRQSTKIVETGLNSLSENGIINTNESEAKNERGENVHLRNGGKRDGGKNTKRQVSRMESSTGQAESRGKTSRIADSEAARLVNEGQEVKVSDLGILGGSKEQTVRVVDKANETSSMKEARKRAEARGLKVKFFVGDNLVIKDKSGEWISSRAFIKGDHVFVRADHALYTADQLMRHELGHDMIAKGEVDIDAVRKRLEETVGKENIDAVAEHYANAYTGTGMSADEIWEECICDSLGDMNIFADNEVISKTVSPMLSLIKAEASESKSPTQTRGSPDGKASRETYTKTQYNNFGWVRVNDVVNEGYWDNFTRNYADAVYNKGFDRITPNGEYMIEIYDQNIEERLQVIDHIVFAKGHIKSPNVTKIIQIYEVDETKLDKYRRNIYDFERRGIQQETGELLELHRKTDFGAYDQESYGREVSRYSKQLGTERGGSSKAASRVKEYIFEVEDSEVSGKASRELDTDGYSKIMSMKSEVNKLREDIKKIESSAEFKTLMDKISEAVANDDVAGGIKIYGDWEKESGYGELVAKRDELESQINKLAKDYENNRAERELNAEKEDIEKSGLSEADYFRKQAVKEFGYTPHYYDAGYILPNGKMLNFSGEKGKHFGTRGEDHRAIGIIYTNTQGTDALVRFMNDGNIRIMAESPGLDISSNAEPSREQYSTIRSFIYDYAKEEYFNIDISDEKGKVIGSLEYEGKINPTRIINDIKHYYETGEIRGQSEVDKFRYSRELDFIDFINEQAGEESDPNLTKSQNVAKVRGELEKMNVGKGEIMSVMKLSDKMFDLYGGDSSISDFRYGLFEATKLALNGSETGFEAAYDIIHTLASEVAYNPKDIGGDADVLAQIKKDIRGTKLAVHEKDKTSGEFDNYGGYGAFRKSHLGKFMLANDGVQVDAKYAELQNLYGESFFPDVNTVSEQLLQMAKLMDTPLSDYMMVTDKELEATADGMVQSLLSRLGDIWSRAIKSGKTIVAPVESDKFSNRSLLASALESAVQNDIERNKLEQYKEKIGFINAEEQKLLELRTKIKELSFKKGPRDTEAIKKLQLEANQAANRINTYDRQLLNLESTKALKGVLEREKDLARKKAEQKGKEALERYREKAAEAQRELMDRYQESRKKATEGRNKTAMRHKIKEVVNDLNNYLFKGTKDKHVPIELQRAVAEALDAVNMDTVGAEERIAKLKAEMMSAKTPEAIQEIAKKIEHIEEMGGNMEAKLSRLKTAYDSIINSEDPLVANSHDDVISSTIEKVMEYVGDTPLRDMSLHQLEAVYDMYRMVLHSIRNANKAFKAKKSEEISVIANRVLEEIDKLNKKKALQTKAGQTISEFDWNNQKPVYAFERIGSDSFTEVFNNVRAGEDTWAVDMTEAREFLENQKQNHKYDSWDFDKKYGFTSSTGKSFELSLGQIMSLYAYSKRGDQAKDHLKNGGFVFDGLTEVKEKNKLGVTKTYQLKDATAYNLSDETLSDILSKLTPEQKAFADAMQDYLSTVMGEKGNDVSLELYGVKLFKEKNYFPLKSAPQYLERAREQAQGDVKIKNKGFTKETTPKAKNPIVLTSFMDVWAGHVNEMSMYHSFTLALEDFYRVFNYKTPASETMDSEGVIPFLENAHGAASVSYIDQLLKDLNGGARSDPRESAAKALMSKFKKASVMASLSVVVQQPSAIVRAQALVDARYFVGKKVSSAKHKETWAEVKKYAPVAIIKEMGYFDVGMGQSSVDWLKGDKTWRDKIDDTLSKAPALADEVTWVAIWNAVKRETAHNNPNLKTSSEEFLKLAGERFTEVIVKTQVYDSTLARSANMRSKSAFMSMWTAFMAEPTTSINMLQDAFKKGNKKMIARTMGAVYGSVVLNAALVSLVYAMRDDDEDETFLEKYLSRLTTEVIDGINPLTYVPFVKDIWSALQGFDIERSDMTLITRVIDSLQQLVKVAVKDTSDMDDAELKEHRKVVSEAILSITDNLASLTGVPVMNIRRDINGIINGFKTITEDVNGRKTTVGSLGDNILEDVKDTVPVWGWLPDEKKGDKLYDAIIKGDKAYEERLKSGYKNDTAINSAIRKALRENDPRINMAAECLNAGDLRRYGVILDTIVAEGHFDEKLVGDAIKAEAKAIKEESKGDSADSSDDDKDEAYSIYQANDINVAFESGDTALAKEIIQDLIDTKVANGMDEKKAKSSLRSSMTSYWKPLYKTASQADKTRIRKILYNSGLYGTVNDVVKTAQDWLKD